MCKISLLGLHFGICWSQFPDCLHLPELDPSMKYLESHVKKAIVSTGYFPFTGDLEYSMSPFSIAKIGHPSTEK